MFRRRTSDARSLVSQTVLLVMQAAMLPRSSEQFGTGTYHVRCFGTGGDLPLMILGDLGNHEAASITNRFDEIAALAAGIHLGVRDAAPLDLRHLARWVEYYPEDAQYPGRPESFIEVWYEPGPGGAPRYRHEIRDHAVLRELVGGPVRKWRAGQYRLHHLSGEGVRVVRITPYGW